MTANDVPLKHLIIRTRDLNARPQNGGAPRRQPKALVNHVAYTIADWDQNRVRAELARLGYRNPEVDTPYSFHVVDVNGYDVQISGIERRRSWSAADQPLESRGLSPAGLFSRRTRT